MVSVPAAPSALCLQSPAHVRVCVCVRAQMLLRTWSADFVARNKVLLFSHSCRCLDLLEVRVRVGCACMCCTCARPACATAAPQLTAVLRAGAAPTRNQHHCTNQTP